MQIENRHRLGRRAVLSVGVALAAAAPSAALGCTIIPVRLKDMKARETRQLKTVKAFLSFAWRRELVEASVLLAEYGPIEIFFEAFSVTAEGDFRLRAINHFIKNCSLLPVNLDSSDIARAGQKVFCRVVIETAEASVDNSDDCGNIGGIESAYLAFGFSGDQISNIVMA